MQKHSNDLFSVKQAEFASQVVGHLVLSPTKHYDRNFETPTISNPIVIPDSDVLLPSASESNGPPKSSARPGKQREQSQNDHGCVVTLHHEVIDLTGDDDAT